jgi:hypothetical protein
MANKTDRIFKALIIGSVLLSVVAAPASQAFSFAGEFSKTEPTCGCCCCQSETEEQSCPVRAEISKGSCPCQVEQQVPFNTKPIESSTPIISIKDFAGQVSALPNVLAGIAEQTASAIPYKIPISNSPPLYILNSSFLI